MSIIPVPTPETKCATCAVRQYGICGQVGKATHARLAQISTIRSYAESRSLWDGEFDEGLTGIVVSGCLRMQHYGFDGRRQISCLLLPGDIISEPGGQMRSGQIEASTPAQVCRFDRAQFQRMLETVPELGRAVYALRHAKLDQLRLLTWSLGVLSVDERVCAFLAFATTFLPYTRLPGGAGVLAVEMPRADIADLLSTSIESISRITRRLDAGGVIRIRAPNLFEIPDLERLVAMGCMQDSFRAHVMSAAIPGPAIAPERLRGGAAGEGGAAIGIGASVSPLRRRNAPPVPARRIAKPGPLGGKDAA
jgi:CRP/FNR family transcriptional regulator